MSKSKVSFKDCTQYVGLSAVLPEKPKFEVTPEEMQWLAFYKLAERVGGRYGITDDVGEIATRVMETLRVDGADPVAQGVWGKPIKNGLEKKDWVTVWSSSFSRAPMDMARQDQIGPATMVAIPQYVSDEGDVLEIEFPVTDDLRRVEVDERLIYRRLSHLSRAVESEWHEMCRLFDDLVLLRNQEAGEDFLDDQDEAPLELARDTRFKERVLEAYADVKTGEAAVKASVASGGGFDIVGQAAWEESVAEAILGEEQDGLNGNGGGNGIAVYLDPEYPHDEGEVESLVDTIKHPPSALAKLAEAAQMVREGRMDVRLLAHLVRQSKKDVGVTWLVHQYRMGKLFPFVQGLDRLAELTRGLSPTEKARFCRVMAAEIATAALADENEFDLVCDQLAAAMADRMDIDLDDEDVQFYLDIGGANLEATSVPVKAIKNADGEPAMPGLDEAIESYCALVEDRSTYGSAEWKPWHPEEVRHIEVRNAFKFGMSHISAGKAAIAEAKRNGLFRKLWNGNRQAPKAPSGRVEMVVTTLRKDGLSDGVTSVTWRSLLRGEVDVVFKERDGGARLASAIRANIVDPQALQFAEGLGIQ